MARICISVGIYCKTHTHTHAHTYICILARKPMWCRDGAMLEEPLRRVAITALLGKLLSPSAVHLLPSMHDG